MNALDEVSNEVTETTACSTGSTLRLTMDCSWLTSAAPITTGSRDWCGMAAWLPRPRTVMSKNDAPAIAAPLQIPNLPGALFGLLCIP